MFKPFLEARNISKAFAGVQALDGVSLAIGSGEIHCLAGENGSGKSTLIKIIAGALEPDAGEIMIEGRPYAPLNPIKAIHAGIQVIYQDFSLFPNLTVAENIALNRRLAEGKRLVNWSEIRRMAREALGKIGIDMDLRATVENLPVADKQLIAIARALLHEARLIVMDEPTTALTEREVRILLRIIGDLRADGVSVLFVSHKLTEIFEVSEKITVLRNGRCVAHDEAKAFDLDKLTRHMTGRTFGTTPARAVPETGSTPLLGVDGLRKSGHFENVSFSLQAGEILGITGLLGCGRTALALALFGLTPVDAGTISVKGQPARIRSAREAIRYGIGYVPEDRLREGLFPGQSIGWNIIASRLDALSGRWNLLDSDSIEREAQKWVERLRIATPSADEAVETLSGGNQQRVVLARWLAMQPQVLILNGPTVGVDIGSKADIHEIITDLAEEGMGIIVISDDLPEVLHVCDRLLIMKSGRILESIGRLELSERELARKLAS